MTGNGPGEDASKEDRRALLELMLAEEGLQAPAPSTIPRRRAAQAPALSYAQERMWFLQQFEDDTSALGIRVALRLHGALDETVFRRSLDIILHRHDSLRTLIASDGGVPRPRPSQITSMPFLVDDLEGQPDQADRLTEILVAEASRTFDLERDVPIVVRLVHLGTHEHVLSVVMHHIASDAWSFRVFFAELAEVYTAELAGRPAKLPELALDYQDYAAWQRTAIDADDRARQMAYWKDRLGTALPVFELPPDHTRPAKHTFDGGQVSAVLGTDLAASLRDLSNRFGASMFMTLLGAFDLVLARHVGNDDVVIGTPVAGRVRPELEPMIGVFLNNLVLRTDLSGDPTFVELLGRVRDVSLGAFENQDVPFERLLGELQPPRDLSRTPLFQVFFNMTNFDVGVDIAAVPEIEGVDYEFITQPDVSAKFDVTLYVDDRGDIANLQLVYNSRLYTPDTMRELLEQYVHLLEQVVRDPHRPIGAYSLVTPRAMATLPHLDAALDATWHGSVPGSVLRRADISPDQLAVADADHQWTYAALASHMCKLASWLRVHGVAKGDVVAIYAHRSSSLVWAVTSVLASGAAYLLLDPKYPPTRLAQYLRVAKPTAWLCLDAAGEPPPEVLAELDRLGVDVRLSLPSDPEFDWIGDGETTDGEADREATLASIDSIGADDLACLTFTSGSSGSPKAVMGRHGSLTHFLPWMSERFEITADDRFSMLSGLSHDPIQRDMFWPLWIGATIVVPDPDSIGNPGWLARWLSSEQVTVAHLTPAMGQLVTEGLDRPSVEPIPSLRRALFIGDVLTRRDVARLRSLAPNVEVINLYGTTETQRASGYTVVDSLDAAAVEKEVLPLGIGMPGVQLLVRTTSGQPAGVGEIGEIYFRSPHIALGYLDDPSGSSERFTGNGPDDDPGDRTYRTGDRGRYRPDGTVEFFGRSDDQVQLRGFRIELGEIQAVLGRHPGVRDAVVNLWSDDRSTPQLVAYVVPATTPGPDVAELRQHLRTALPPHMIPAHIVTIDELPLTPNGKLDRRALPRPTIDTSAVSASSEPHDQLERMLVGIWREVLDHDHIGVHDDFFDLGGFSLLATRLFALIEERTGKRLPISTLFETPTIAQLADVIRNDGWSSNWSSLVPIQANGTQPPFFYVAPYLISVLQFVHLGEELGNDQPLYGLQPQGLDGTRPAHRTVEEMAADYISELKTVQPAGPYLVGGHCSGAWVAFEMARQLEANGDSLRAVVLVDQGPPLADRPMIHPIVYLVNRMRFYFREGRFRQSLAWKVRIATARYLLRRVGPPTARYVEEVREAHRDAFRQYEGGDIKHDIVLIRSSESLALADKSWYVQWEGRTDGSLETTSVPGTHANLLERPYVEELAAQLRRVFERARRADA